MTADQRLAVKTAAKKDSIWRGLPEDRLRNHMVALERASNGVPDDAKVHLLTKWESARGHRQESSRRLPLLVEQRLADDLAFIAAAGENVKAVSAVAIEERIDTPGLIIRLAANDLVSANVVEALRTMLLTIVKCAGRSTWLAPSLKRQGLHYDDQDYLVRLVLRNSSIA